MCSSGTARRSTRRTSRGETPLDNAILDEGTTRYFASLLQLELNEDGLGTPQGRDRGVPAPARRDGGAEDGRGGSADADAPLQPPLVPLVPLVARCSDMRPSPPSARGFRRSACPTWLVLSPARYLWLVPLTMIPQSFMGDGGDSPIFGPDTSTGLLPIPHVLAYYAIFFGFGALYFGFDDRSGRVGERWWLPLSIGLLVVLPLGMALTEGWSGPPGVGLGPLPRRILSIFLQAAYPWLMTFGLMGLFRRVCPVESPTMRYLSDSAYWLYLAHLPLIIAAQYVVRDWPIPALAKFLLIVVVVTSFLLWTYQTLVRYTWLGRFLNGPRVRPARRLPPAVVA